MDEKKGAAGQRGATAGGADAESAAAASADAESAAAAGAAVEGAIAGGADAEGVAGGSGCGCRHKATPRSAELQADVQKRLNRAIGQLTGVKAMVEDNRYCGDVLTQLAAAESAVRRVSELLLEEHLRTCVAEGLRAGDDEVVDEAVALMRRFR